MKSSSLLYLTIAISVMTTFLLFIMTYTEFNSPQILLEKSEIVFTGKENFHFVSLDKKLLLPKNDNISPSISPYDILPDRQPLFFNYNALVITKLRIPLRLRHKHHITVFKSWIKGRITEMSPSLRQNCSELMAGDSSEIQRVTQLLNHTNTTNVFTDNLLNCTQILHEFNDNFYISKQEREFPIAFLLVIHTNAEQVSRFLKAIYRSHNLYCIHPDLNSGNQFIQIFKLISSCLPNVFVPSNVSAVNYNNDHTILEAQLSCMRALEAYKYREWKYVINLCGRELPLQTNGYIVEILKLLNGTSNVKPYHVDTYTLKTRFPKLTKVFSPYYCKDNEVGCVEDRVDLLYNHNIKLYKSMAYNALSLEFVRYILYNDTMQSLTQWMLTYCRAPEEHFYATAYMMPEAPGGFHIKRSKKLSQVSKTIWKHEKTSHYYIEGETCAGNSVHQVCILSTPDLPIIQRSISLGVWFFNKYFMEEDHVVMDCVEEELVKANRQEFERYYRNKTHHLTSSSH